jgi:N-acetylglucosamine kinase-like BadF-type ATPase
LPDADTVEVAGDLLGAARALCGSNEGIACILGTGANSCLYDGRQIIANTPPLGYVLGDEGSGAVLGIRFLNAVLKGLLPERLKTELLDWLQMTEADIIGRIYRQPLANRWLASLSLFIATHIDETDVRALVTDNFRQFFRRNVVQYGRRDLPVCFVGSIAHYYREQLGEAAAAEGFTLGRVEKSPVDGLTAYHAG